MKTTGKRKTNYYMLAKATKLSYAVRKPFFCPFRTLFAPSHIGIWHRKKTRNKKPHSEPPKQEQATGFLIEVIDFGEKLPILIDLFLSKAVQAFTFLQLLNG